MTTSNNDLAAYYAKCAGTYGKIYEKPDRQADLAILHRRVSEVLANHRVLELACGTGYWTRQYAAVAESVLATDINPEMLALAQADAAPLPNVKWAYADAYDLQVGEPHSACFAGFWWSHVLRQDQESFLQQLRQKLGKDTLLVLMDNIYVEGSSTTIARTDHEGNTFQIRTLPDGSRHEVLKNFPSDSALRKKLAASTREIRIERTERYWMLTCRLK